MSLCECNKESNNNEHGGHSVACLYEYALARLGLKDSDDLRVIFWDCHEALQWDDKTDSYITPKLEGENK